MKPKFKTPLAWEQAEILLQPAFIRVIDNLRKELDNSPWQGTYEEIQDPFPGYLLCLRREDISININIWELCFRVCFMEYNDMKDTNQSYHEVDIDTSLIDEAGNVEWQRLENKTQEIIRKIFISLG